MNFKDMIRKIGVATILGTMACVLGLTAPLTSEAATSIQGYAESASSTKTWSYPYNGKTYYGYDEYGQLLEGSVYYPVKGSGEGFYWRNSTVSTATELGGFTTDYLVAPNTTSISNLVESKVDDQTARLITAGTIFYPNGGNESNFQSGLIKNKQTPAGNHVYAYEMADHTNMKIGRILTSYTDHTDIHGSLALSWAGFAATTTLPVYDGYFGSKETIGCGAGSQPGWLAYCATCGQPIFINIYASADTASKMKYLPIGTQYAYVCPHDSHILDQGVSIGHTCQAFSINRYKLQLNPNVPSGATALNYSNNPASGYYYEVPKSEWYYYNIFEDSTNKYTYEGNLVPTKNANE